MKARQEHGRNGIGVGSGTTSGYSVLDGFALVLGARSRWCIRLVHGFVVGFFVAMALYRLWTRALGRR